MRDILRMALAIGFLVLAASAVNAGTTGTVTGTVVDNATGAPVANVQVTITAPTGRARATTNSKGFYALTGLPVDTYSVSFSRTGYEPNVVNGVTVQADQTQIVNGRITKSVRQIGTVTVRGQTGAFQPTQVTDTYNVGPSQIEAVQGKRGEQSETDLLTALPGASLDSSGYPVLRGGRENEEGFQFEGIDYTDAFTSQFVNSLAINGVQSLQLIPGPGDASQGNAGTGVINLTAKRGTRPPFGLFGYETEANSGYYHKTTAEYGFASFDGRWSNYVSFIGNNSQDQHGDPGVPSAKLGEFYGGNGEFGRDLVDNLVYKFGKADNQQMQLFYQNQIFEFPQNYGGISTLHFKTGDPYYLANLSAFSGLSPDQIQSVIGFDPQQTSVDQMVNRVSTYFQPNATMKLQYSNNINSSTYFTARLYKVNSVVTFDFPNSSNAFTFFGSTVTQQGGQRSGIASDFTKQLNSKHLFEVGGKYEFLHPVFSQPENLYGFLAVGAFGSGYEVADFLPSTDTNCPGFVVGCGYLEQFFPNGVPKVPAYYAATATNRQDFALYGEDKITPNDRLHLSVGLRYDGSNYRLPDPNTSGLYLPTSTDSNGNPVYNIDKQAVKPRVWEPRFGASFQITKNDAIRFNYGRSVQFAPLGDVDYYVDPRFYSAFAGIPSYDNFAGSQYNAATHSGGAAFCGVTGNQLCVTYANQLRWENQNAIAGVPIQPVKPETFNNFDMSLEHQFPNNVGVRLTPYYRRGYDALALTQTVKAFDATGAPVYNPPVATNLGTNKTTGVEFLLTKDAFYGFSGSLAMTYINEFSNVPPLSGNEDFFPTIPPASLALGNVYRVGFISPFQATLSASYRSQTGLKINPIIRYDKGYPIGSGLLTQATVNNKNVNLPSTNVTNPNGSNQSGQYVDPLNPGTLFNPNIVATRGTPEGNDPGAFLSSARLNTDVVVEYSPQKTRNATYGVKFFNLFNQLYEEPIYNARYQPVATGIPGPNSGLSSLPLRFPGLGYYQYGPEQFGNLPYRFRPNQTPTAIKFYVQFGF